MLDVQVATLKRQGKQIDDRELNTITDDLRPATTARLIFGTRRLEAGSMRFSTLATREVLALALDLATRQRETSGFPVGVFQV